MLGGIDPIMIFQFSEMSESLKKKLEKTPFIGKELASMKLLPIPIYLSEQLTGLYVQDESKQIAFSTTQNTRTDGDGVDTYQKGLFNNIKISLVATRESIGLTLLFALSDQVFEKATSGEYAISYLNGAVTVFNGLLEEISITQEASTTKYNIELRLTTQKAETKDKKEIPTLGKAPKPVVL